MEPGRGLNNVSSTTSRDGPPKLQACATPVFGGESKKKMFYTDKSRSAVGQFTISLTKVCGSLGFTLRQLDDTVLKHTIKVGFIIWIACLGGWS